MHCGHPEELPCFLLEAEVCAAALGCAHLPEVHQGPAGPTTLPPAPGGEEEEGGGRAANQGRGGGEVGGALLDHTCHCLLILPVRARQGSGVIFIKTILGSQAPKVHHIVTNITGDMWPGYSYNCLCLLILHHIILFVYSGVRMSETTRENASIFLFKFNTNFLLPIILSA